MTTPIRKALLLCSVLLAAGPAAAQYQMMSPMLYEGPRISLQDHAAATTPPKSAAQAPDPARFRFTPSRERRKENLARFVAKSRATDPQGADSLAALFAQGDIIERMRPELAKYGLGIDNVADAYTVWWINAWQASRGIDDDVSPATAAAVRGQVMRSIAANPLFQGSGDAVKQEMAESLLVQSLLLSAAVGQAKQQSGHKPDPMSAVRAAAAQGARGMGIDLSAMTLTEQGFVPSGRPG